MKGIVVFCITLITLCAVSESLALPLSIYEGEGSGRSGSAAAAQGSIGAKKKQTFWRYNSFCLRSDAVNNTVYYKSCFIESSGDRASLDSGEWLYFTYDDGGANSSGLSALSLFEVIPSGI